MKAARNPIDGFSVDRASISYLGESLQRPECILAERDGSLWSADARGGVGPDTPPGARRMNFAAKGGGALRRVLENARHELRCSRNRLTVLSSQVDPYRLDTPAGHRDGAWLAEQLDRAVGAERRIHWRGLHYAIVAAGDIRKPNGEVYRNDDANWTWLANNAR
jgi:hypothetical protein